MIQLELGKFYIDRNYDVVCIFNKADGVRLKGGAFIDLFIGIKLNEDLDLKDREFYLYDIQGNEYNKGIPQLSMRNGNGKCHFGRRQSKCDNS